VRDATSSKSWALIRVCRGGFSLSWSSGVFSGGWARPVGVDGGFVDGADAFG